MVIVVEAEFVVLFFWAFPFGSGPLLQVLGPSSELLRTSSNLLCHGSPRSGPSPSLGSPPPRSQLSLRSVADSGLSASVPNADQRDHISQCTKYIGNE